MKSLMHSERPRRLHLCFISFTGLMQVIFLVILFLFVCSFSSLEVNRLGVNLNFDVKLKFLVLMVVKQNLKIWLKCNCNSKKTGAKKKKSTAFITMCEKKKPQTKLIGLSVLFMFQWGNVSSNHLQIHKAPLHFCRCLLIPLCFSRRSTFICKTKQSSTSFWMLI